MGSRLRSAVAQSSHYTNQIPISDCQAGMVLLKRRLCVLFLHNKTDGIWVLAAFAMYSAKSRLDNSNWTHHMYAYSWGSRLS